MNRKSMWTVFVIGPRAWDYPIRDGAAREVGGG